MSAYFFRDMQKKPFAQENALKPVTFSKWPEFIRTKI